MADQDYGDSEGKTAEHNEVEPVGPVPVEEPKEEEATGEPTEPATEPVTDSGTQPYEGGQS